MFTTLLPLLLLVGVMFVMARNAKKKQQQAVEMRNRMAPGSGVRTIGGLYATVKSVNDDTVELEVAPGVRVRYAKNAVAAVLDPQEYAAVIDGVPASEAEVPSFKAEGEETVPPVALRKDAPRASDHDGSAADALSTQVSGSREGEGPAAK